MRLHVPRVHPRKFGFRPRDGEARPLREDVQVAVGHKGRDLDDHVAIRVKPRHFEVDPREVGGVTPAGGAHRSRLPRPDVRDEPSEETAPGVPVYRLSMRILLRRRHVPARFFVGVSALVFALALAGCGGDSEPAPGTPTTTTTATAVTKKGDRVVKNGDTVSVHYRGTLDDGTEFDSSKGREPLSFTVGSGQVISGFDDAVMGLKVGDKNKVRLEPAKAYGERREEMVVTVPGAQAPAGLKAGDRVQVGGAPAVVTRVDAAGVTVDANHALAGKALTFEVELVSIK